MVQFINPVTFPYVVTSRYGDYRNYGNHQHEGIDLAPRGGTSKEIVSAAGGKIIAAGWSNVGYGNYIVIDHGGGLRTLYGHLSTIQVQQGQEVGAGQPIGIVGSTGNATGTHLHFTVQVNGVDVNPTPYLTGAVRENLTQAQAIQQSSAPMAPRQPVQLTPIRARQVSVNGGSGSSGFGSDTPTIGNYGLPITPVAISAYATDIIAVLGNQIKSIFEELGTDSQSWFIKNRGYILATVVIILFTNAALQKVVE